MNFINIIHCILRWFFQKFKYFMLDFMNFFFFKDCKFYKKFKPVKMKVEWYLNYKHFWGNLRLRIDLNETSFDNINLSHFLSESSNILMRIFQLLIYAFAFLNPEKKMVFHLQMTININSTDYSFSIRTANMQRCYVILNFAVMAANFDTYTYLLKKKINFYCLSYMKVLCVRLE